MFPTVDKLKLDLRSVVVVVAFCVALSGLFAAMQYQVSANDKVIAVHEEKIETIESEIDHVEAQAKQNAETAEDLIEGVNWIGTALQAIANKQDVELPPRPIVSD